MTQCLLHIANYDHIWWQTVYIMLFQFTVISKKIPHTGPKAVIFCKFKNEDKSPWLSRAARNSDLSIHGKDFLFQISLRRKEISVTHADSIEECISFSSRIMIRRMWWRCIHAYNALLLILLDWLFISCFPVNNAATYYCVNDISERFQFLIELILAVIFSSSLLTKKHSNLWERVSHSTRTRSWCTSRVSVYQSPYVYEFSGK